MAKAKPAPKKAAPKKAAAKKPAAKKAAKPKLPFYATLLSKQHASGLKATSKENDSFKTEKYPNDEADVVYKKEAGSVYSFAGAMTSKRKDQVIVTLKYPSDTDEAVTLKYPSDDDEMITRKFPSDTDEALQTMKYPSDSDEDITINEGKPGEFATTRYPNDEYATAIDTLQSYKLPKGVTAATTSVSKDTVQTLKYPSDQDEDTTLKYPSDRDEAIGI